MPATGEGKMTHSDELYGSTGADEEPTNWERQIGRAAIALMGVFVDHMATGTVAFAPEESEAIEASIDAVVHDADERADFVAQAMALAKDLVRNSHAAVAAFRAEDADARVIFSTLDQMPVELLGQPLSPLPPDEDPHPVAPDRLTEYEYRSLHQAAHAKVGLTLLQVPIVASFHRFRVGVPGTVYPLDARLRTLAAGDALNFLVADRLGFDFDLEAWECRCHAMAMTQIGEVLWGTADLPVAPGQDQERSELHYQHVAETMPILRSALESGELDDLARQIRRYGRVRLEPEVTPHGT
jgi:hypothetical protein